MWEPCNLSRQTNANFPRFLCRDSSSMVSKKNGYICAVMYHFYDYVVWTCMYVIILDAIIQVPRPIIHIIRYYPFFCLITFVCMYIWVMVLLYYIVCVVVYGMNIMMHIESTNYCILYILRVCRWVLNSHWVLEVSKFSIESTCRWKTAQISVCIYCAVIFTCSLGIPIFLSHVIDYHWPS